MSTSPSPYAVALEQYVQRHKLRRTSERFEVLEAIEQSPARFTINDVARIAVTGGCPVSRGTVVNTVELLVEAGIVMEIGRNGRDVLYQLVSRLKRKGRMSGFPMTIALQCRQCGKIKEVSDKSATAAFTSRRYSAFTPTGGVITIFGLCKKCGDDKDSPNTTKQ